MPIATTILGVTRELEARTGTPPRNDLQTTLNHKYGVQPDLTPTSGTRVLYFGVGINGRATVDDGFLTKPRPVKTTNMDLYLPVPIRCVPVEQDLTPSQRINYRMRRVETIGGDNYACYYLKRLAYTDEEVRYSQIDTNGVEIDYAIDYSNLTPTPPAPPLNGVVTDPASEVNISVTANVHLTGEELIEGITVKYDGNLDYAVVSEIGLYSGEDRVVSAVDYLGTSFTYTEAILAQLACHFTWNGMDMANPQAILDKAFRFSNSDVVLL